MSFHTRSEGRLYPNIGLFKVSLADTSHIEEPSMYHYDPKTALEELIEEAVLPNPVRVRDMMLRAHLDAAHSLEYNRLNEPISMPLIRWSITGCSSNIRRASASCRNSGDSCWKD